MTIQIVNIEAVEKFSADGAQHIVLHKSEGLVTLLVCLEPGQEVGPCVMSARVQYFVIAGSGQLHVAEEQAELKTGSVVVVASGIVRRIVAVEQMRILAIQVP